MVALVNTLDRVSSSLTALNKMRDMVNENEMPFAKISASDPKSYGIPDLDKKNAPSGTKERLNAKGAVAPDYYSDGFDDEDDVVRDDGTIWQIFLDEWNLVWRTYIYVLKSWVEIPGKMFRIIVVELSRLWSFWLGLPVVERSWEFTWHPPQKDEL